MKEPLAFRMRPKTLEEVIGQIDLVGPSSFLYKSKENGTPFSFVLYYVSGCSILYILLLKVSVA